MFIVKDQQAHTLTWNVIFYFSGKTCQPNISPAIYQYDPDDVFEFLGLDDDEAKRNDIEESCQLLDGYTDKNSPFLFTYSRTDNKISLTLTKSNPVTTQDIYYEYSEARDPSWGP